MRKNLVIASLLAMAVSFVQPAFAAKVIVSDSGESYVFVQEAPPAELVEQITVSPGPDYVWTKGYWRWDNKWVWESGRWGRRPHPAAVWHDGEWVHHDRYHGWHWVHGHWH